MAKIQSVRISAKEDKTLVIFKVEGSESRIFLTDRQVTAATGLKSNFGVLQGSDLDVSYYQEGDEMVGGAKCTKGDTIVNDFEITLSERLQGISAVAGFGGAFRV